MSEPKYTPEDVEKFSRVMKAEGVHQLELPGLKLVRSPQADAYREMAERAAGLQTNELRRPLSPEELLHNPFQGIPGYDDDSDHGEVKPNG